MKPNRMIEAPQTINKKDYDLYVAEKNAIEKSVKLDNYLLLFLFLASAIGAYFALIRNPNTEQLAAETLKSNALWRYKKANSKMTNAAEHLVAQKASTKVQYNKGNSILSIRGTFLANEVLSFIINDFDEALEYSISFGDGRFREVRADEISYLYPKVGDFHVTLRVADNDEQRIVYSNVIHINK